MREATAHFVRKGLHYLVTSGTTGYFPNPSEIAVAKTWHGPYEVLGNPHPNDLTNTSFHSQISSVFKVQGKKDLFIACADRWLPKRMDAKYEDYARIFESIFAPNKDPLDFSALGDVDDGTDIADYVWLPFRFDEEMGYLDWLDEWRIEDYD